jgi:hypothetical protein
MGKEKRLARKAKKAAKEAEMKELYKDEDSVIEYSGGKPVMRNGGVPPISELSEPSNWQTRPPRYTETKAQALGFNPYIPPAPQIVDSSTPVPVPTVKESMKTGGMINPNKAFNPFDLKSNNFKKQ